MLKAILGNDPRTTVIGYAGAIATALLPVLQTGKFTTRDLILAAIIAVLGRVAGDSKGK